MTITVPTTLGPSWVPKLGGLLAIIGAALAVVPDTAPGAPYIKPWVPFINSVAIGFIGFSVRQNNVSSDQAGVKRPTAPEQPPKP